jgi:signal transduction histidine kinase/type II secretory pathway pseudopilin PulG
MKLLQTYGSAVIIVVIAMVIILPLLAYLQYTWLGQISEQEYERMKQNLQTTAFHCSMDFSREITDLMKSLGGTLIGSDDDVEKTLHERIIKWQTISTYPAIVSTEIKIGSSPSPEQTVQIKADEESMLFLFKDLSAMAIPIKNRSHEVVLVPLNLEYISSSILPKIIKTNFSSITRSEYDIVIINDKGNHIYNSVDTTKHDILQKADLVIPFLTFPQVPPLSSMPPDRPILNRMHLYRENPPEPFERNPRELERRYDLPPPQGNMMPREEERRLRERGLFEMQLKHREGSLEIAVNKNRLRNFGISFGVLILLGASIVFLLLSTNRARRLAQQQLEFVAGISHELRTPLAVLKSAGENLADGVIQEKDRTRKYGELIKNEVIRLSDMVEKALAYAGIHSGKQNYELRSIDITPIITEAIQNAKKLLPSYNFKADTVIDLNLPQVLGDATALQSAIENLIVNGIKYSLEKKWINIEAHQVKNSNGSFVEIKVIDRGIGIAAADFSHIFKPFYRGQNAIEGQIQGSGLGLSITRHIIELHGGTISIKSSPNEGSVFTILLPSIIQDEESK